MVYTGDRTDLIDTDELFAAHRDGLLTIEAAEAALQHVVVAIEGLARHGHDLNAWLAADGMNLTWRSAAADGQLIGTPVPNE